MPGQFLGRYLIKKYVHCLSFSFSASISLALINTFRLVACFQHELPMEVSFMTFARGSRIGDQGFII